MKEVLSLFKSLTGRVSAEKLIACLLDWESERARERVWCFENDWVCLSGWSHDQHLHQPDFFHQRQLTWKLQPAAQRKRILHKRSNWSIPVIFLHKLFKIKLLNQLNCSVRSDQAVVVQRVSGNSVNAKKFLRSIWSMAMTWRCLESLTSELPSDTAFPIRTEGKVTQLLCL